MSTINRRVFVAGAAAAGALGLRSRAAGKAVRVLVWDEQQPAQKQAYENYLGNAVADHLRSKGDAFEVRTARLDDPGQGLASDVLDTTDVLIWWGHQRHGEVKPDTAQMLVSRIREGRLSLLALHSAHWSVPFIEAMNARAVDDALNLLPEKDRKSARVRTVAAPKRLMKRDEPLTPSSTHSAGADGVVDVEVKLPSCVFLSVRADGKPSHVRTVMPQHPIARGVPEAFDIPQTEMYEAPFHVPTPDAIIFEEKWDAGEQFPAGCLWKLGKGQVFYFRPGHETYPIFKQEYPLRIVENATAFLGRR